ncbi:MAG: zf-HC2 domain-containing protein [candidate division Zixibacteria bacterium]|nr:zf-HC2 domain-containing protein [candidate division Zixibacteria bacterium]MDH3936247.1 zf-HC2 domain-containing protein [candidate division Zixibacteria bacterium]MDH4034878.1 zf-HC2 domain-containing protein [candidate division Zixibacteria bacterium]
MNCQEALDLLYDIIDKEANEIDAAEVQRHVNSCRDCLKIYRLETSVHDLIAERLKNNGAEGNIEGLKAKVIMQLDAIDKESVPGAPPRSYSLIAKTMVAVASVVIVIGAVSLASDYYRHVNLYVPFEASHYQVLEPDFQPGIVPDGSYLGLDFSSLGKELGFQLISNFTEDFDGVQMAHFVFHNGEQSVSVFAAPSSEFTIPDDLSDAAVTRDGTVFFDHTCHDCRLLFHQVGNAVIIAASEREGLDLFDFTPVEEMVLTKLLLP